jgi:VWFA-related protein
MLAQIIILRINKFMKNLFLLLLLTLLSFASVSQAQKNTKTLISIPVSVSDREGRYISGLKKDDFTILQDGKKQKIELFATYEEPLSIALLLDTSGSTQGEALEKIKDAAREFIGLLNTNDKCMLATFDSELNILNPFSSNQSELKKSVEKIQTASKDGTILHRAVSKIAGTSFENVEGRKVIVILSDGKDFGSNLSKIEVLNQLEESDVMIYSIFYQTGEGFNKLSIATDGKVNEAKPNKKIKKPKPPKKPRGYSIGIPAAIDIIPEEEIKADRKRADIEAVDSLRAMSDTTAGRFYLSDTPNLNKIFKQVAAELRQQYRLGYHSTETGNGSTSRDIIVKVNRPDAVVQTRGKIRGK